MKTATATNVLGQTMMCLLITFVLCCCTLVEGAGSSSRRQPRQSREDEEKERYRKPFGIILAAIFLSIAPLLGRLIHAIFTDPVVPILWNELKLRTKKLLKERFGNLAQPADKRVYVRRKEDWCIGIGCPVFSRFDATADPHRWIKFIATLDQRIFSSLCKSDMTKSLGTCVAD